MVFIIKNSFLKGKAIIIDNFFYRQLNACDVLRASNELRTLRDKELITQKGKGKATYYIAGNNLNTEPLELNTEPRALNTEPQALIQELPYVLREKIEQLGQREVDIEKIKDLIYEICKNKSCSVKELSILLNRKENTVFRNYIVPLKEEGKLVYTIPDMPNHPDQAYKSK